MELRTPQAGVDDAEFRHEVRTWLEANAERIDDDLAGHAMQFRGESDLEVARRQQRSLVENRLAGITWPSEYGGRGATAAHQLAFDEEARHYDMPTEVFGVGIGFGGHALMAEGSAAQKARYLPPLLRGEEIWCQLFSEPGAGSDLASLRTTAVRDGAEWVVEGQKVWSTGAHFSNLGMLLARTDPDEPGARGISFFLIDMHGANIDVRPLRQINGEAHFSEVFLDGARVPDANRVGAVNGGWQVTAAALLAERTMAGGHHLLPEVRAVRSLVERSLGDDAPSAIRRDRLARVLTDVFVNDLVRFRALTIGPTSVSEDLAASLTKLASGRIAKAIAELTLDALGPDGALLGRDAAHNGAWQENFLSAPAIRIAGGSEEIQRNILAERVLGLPRGPR